MGNAEVGHHVSQILLSHPGRPRMELELSSMSSVISVIRNLTQSSGFQLLATTYSMLMHDAIVNANSDEQLRRRSAVRSWYHSGRRTLV